MVPSVCLAETLWPRVRVERLWMDSLVGATEMCVEHDLPDPLLKASSTTSGPVDEYWGKGLPVWCDCRPETVVQAVAHEVVCKVAWAIICGYKNV